MSMKLHIYDILKLSLKDVPFISLHGSEGFIGVRVHLRNYLRFVLKSKFEKPLPLIWNPSLANIMSFLLNQDQGLMDSCFNMNIILSFSIPYAEEMLF